MDYELEESKRNADFEKFQDLYQRSLETRDRLQKDIVDIICIQRQASADVRQYFRDKKKRVPSSITEENKQNLTQLIARLEQTIRQKKVSLSKSENILWWAYRRYKDAKDSRDSLHSDYVAHQARTYILRPLQRSIISLYATIHWCCEKLYHWLRPPVAH